MQRRFCCIKGQAQIVATFASVCLFLILPCDYANIISFYFMRNPFKIFAVQRTKWNDESAHNEYISRWYAYRVIIETFDLRKRRTICPTVKCKRTYVFWLCRCRQLITDNSQSEKLRYSFLCNSSRLQKLRKKQTFIYVSPIDAV